MEGTESRGSADGSATAVAELVARREASQDETVRANRTWWDANADEYQADHGEYLGDARFLWGPEGLYEEDAGMLGEVAGLDVLEIGCGAAQCARWLADRGARVAALDVSARQLQHARRIDEQQGRAPLRLVQADATRLPFADESFHILCSAFGAIPFVADSALLMREAARVLRPGGRWVFAVPHPVRWALPDLPGEEGLVVRHSYFDRRPYVEQDEDGSAGYVEHHRTLGDRIRELTAAGLRLVDLVEPEYPRDLGEPWGGGWSALRGGLIPGTAIFVTRKDG
ncbi:methyltransferase domain-containing protein [Actinospica durhamensis]|uniref:Methyltransferase domain-containing protein n=1 Tax=Actinospica durhamensis TaxID=1508375 RepID=A0A941ENJ0_9ACTN|nr:class I SAM-dependent methyltransferase [Actinospica durhamensis]MBR7834203.1 methyltransferase domain-containing protein [Actinospica durhamensis]